MSLGYDKAQSADWALLFSDAVRCRASWAALGQDPLCHPFGVDSFLWLLLQLCHPFGVIFLLTSLNNTRKCSSLQPLMKAQPQRGENNCSKRRRVTQPRRGEIIIASQRQRFNPEGVTYLNRAL